MNTTELTLVVKNLQTMLKLQNEVIYNLQEEIKLIKKENNLL